MRTHKYKGLMSTIKHNICGDGYDADVRANIIFNTAKNRIDKAYQRGRAEAIDEFAERLSNWCADECFLKSIDGVEAELLTLDGITDMIFELAEKLKEKESG